MGLWGIIEKEFRHIVRDYRTLLILILMTVLQMVLFGYALNLEIQNVNLKIDDRDNSHFSRELIRSFRGSRFFTIVETEESNILVLFHQQKILVNLTIPDDFSQKLHANQAVDIDVIIDGSNSNSAILVKQYIAGVILKFKSRFDTKTIIPVHLQPQYKYNAELKSSFFFVPGITALIMIMVTALLTSLTITREKEQGTFNLLKISPLRSSEVIIGKVVPYLILSMIIGIMIIVLGMILFNVPIHGSIAALLFYIFIYCLTGLSFGIMISTIAPSQQIAMLIALLATLLPTLFLSGFIFPLESMPDILQWLSTIIPAKYFLLIIRGLMLKGNIQAELIYPILMLIGFSILFLTVAIKRFTQYMEN